jgi:hypothetical protein
MMVRFALSKLLQIILRLWGVEAPVAGSHSSADEFPRTTSRRIRTRNGNKVSIASRSAQSREQLGPR